MVTLPLPSKLTSFVWHYLKDKKRHLLGFFLVALVWAIEMSLSPFLLKTIIDRVMYYSTRAPALVVPAILLPAVLYGAMTFVTNANFRLYDYINLRLFPSIRAAMEQDLLSEVLAPSYGMLEDNGRRALIQKITDLKENIEPLIAIPNAWFYPRLLAVIVACSTLGLVVYPIFSIILATWAILFILLSYVAALGAEPYSRHYADTETKLSAATSDCVLHRVNLRLFDTTDEALAAFDTASNTVIQSHRQLLWYRLNRSFIQGLAASIMIISMLASLIYGLNKAWFTPGDFAMVLTLSINFLRSIHPLGEQIHRFTKVVDTCRQALDGIREGVSNP